MGSASKATTTTRTSVAGHSRERPLGALCCGDRLGSVLDNGSIGVTQNFKTMSLEFHNVSHSYGATRVLQDISFNAALGEILCLLGPSGGGKSTLLRLAAGLERLQEGELTLDSQPLARPGIEPPPEERPIGLVFQDHVLFPHLNVAANLAFGLRGQTEPAKAARVCELLDQMDLNGLGKRYPHELSGGQQQRVALARAMAPKPRVLLLDEPFASVDSTLRRQLRRTTRTVLKASGTTAIVVTHDPEEAMELADSIAVMAGGSIAQHASPTEIWRQPATLDVALLFGDAAEIEVHADGTGAKSLFGTLNSPCPEGAATLAVRPQGVRLSAPDATHPATALVKDLRLLGQRWQVHLEALADPSATIIASADSPDGCAVGCKVHTALDPENCFLFITNKQ